MYRKSQSPTKDMEDKVDKDDHRTFYFDPIKKKPVMVYQGNIYASSTWIQTEGKSRSYMWADCSSWTTSAGSQECQKDKEDKEDKEVKEDKKDEKDEKDEKKKIQKQK